MRRSLPVLIGIFALLAAVPVMATPLDEARSAYDRGDGATAVQLFTPLAEAGNVAAQEALLHIYAYGEGVPVDLAQCLKWAKRAAALGSAMGENSLGVAYANGEGDIKRDPHQALYWFQKAAASGNAKANVSLARRYLYGQSVTANPALGLDYLRAAADAGSDRAQAAFGSFLFNGKFGQLPDFQQAAHYFELAASQRHAGAENFLGLLYGGGLGVEKDDAKAAMWLTLSARQACRPAAVALQVLARQATPAAMAAGAQLAKAWDAAHPGRDPHLHAEDATDGCSSSGPSATV